MEVAASVVLFVGEMGKGDFTQASLIGNIATGQGFQSNMHSRSWQRWCTSIPHEHKPEAEGIGRSMPFKTMARSTR
eukprot:1153088-Pelagomonas_calceolata.AAC.9